MPDYLAQVLQRHPQNAPPWLDAVHREGRRSCLARTLPTPKTESWKYTSLRALEQDNYAGLPTPAQAPLETHYHIDGFDSYTLVFVNGHFSPALSGNALPEGVELVRFSEADEAQARAIQTRLGEVAQREQSIFTALNESGLQDGVYLRVKPNVRLETPIQVVWLTTPQSEAFTVSQRLLLVMESGSEAELLEYFTSDTTQQNSFTNGITELVLGDNARLQHYRLHTEQEQALHIGGVHASLGRDADLNSFHLATGGALKRIDIVVNHAGPGAHCTLQGVYLLRNKQHVDYHTCIEHRVPHCTTDEVFRGIVGGAARAVFNGRIHIHPNAQKTLAQLSNKNLLTSAQAEVDTKPELEIYADDVQCAHGATVAQLDETSLHYLRTRGLAPEQARVMLSFGFINELLNRIADPAVATHLRPLLSDFFGDGNHLAEPPV
ncbi:Fe-S cluster assembly protein SufD [Exilibacterium tricleocarpae]|uniref:Fe-S cluster assembly protein SufD n=1 Tax=Exilibacterium tricleocarpae TaxID=2591008 RepID=A0A545U6P3_9GAMM|nr:Fe-S cluster assembly protein SufD [Exilibacterium tricleocarpae]TQV85138.1 Fe-S cluster assembly protein SufD [Exilibacterium tricleocarpae]